MAHRRVNAAKFISRYRSCGELARDGLRVLWTGGSPPLARGTHADVVADVIGDRLTPARAGNSTTSP